MCGIAGILQFQEPIMPELIRQMTQIIAHRGPDGDGHWTSEDKKVALGHRRLSIIDLSEGGKQPMHYAEGRYTITFNGEIYNYIEIKKNLVQKGYIFHSQSDTEVLLALYHEKREQCLGDLDGMFAFAIWDNKDKTLFCARDRFGEKPFFYHHHPSSHFVFASEMKALWEYGIPKKINPQMMYNFLLNIWATNNPQNWQDSFYQGIFRLEKGCFAIINAQGQLKIQKYWQPVVQVNDAITMTQASETLYELMLESVKRRLRADVPVGSSLSGGLDSSTIVCMIDRLNEHNYIQQKTFSARFPNFEKDESKFMDYVIAQVKATPHATYPDAEGFANDFKKLCWHQEEPFATASIFAQWEVMKLAKKQGVTVLLDGQGADEMLAGYHFYYTIFHGDLYRSNVKKMYREYQGYQEIYGKMPDFIPPFMHPMNRNRNYWRELVGLAKIHLKKIVGLHQNINLLQADSINLMVKEAALNPDFVAQFHQEDIFDFYTPIKDLDLNQKLCYDTQHGLEQLLRYADRNSMAHSREVRLPFLYHKLVEFIFTLPSHFKIHHGWTKYVQRKAFEGILPSEITWRKDKIGYEPPQKSWMEQPIMRDFVHESKEKLEKEHILNPKRNKEQDIDFAYLTIAQFLD
jgi:asparagine synthase (glutamine-hydrolysing)